MGSEWSCRPANSTLCTYTYKLNTALCFTCPNIYMFGIGQKPNGFASSDNSNIKSELIS